ncbi:adenylate/guanylate cyclase domain-containing protein [Nocardioides limicola]|uniref:adenylate/guanylate cyclase domain-containing protein n=1 Tax=Nocardioides limicola TaxID=2803368 RepID=UPI00193BE213|nr:adenylate/guanylate cyclase domain-containing protein [Nocardioides sp. DJM-14]
MRLRLVRLLHRRSGAQYWLVVAAAEGGAAVLVALATVLLVSTYFATSWSSVALVALVAACGTAAAAGHAALRMRPKLARFRDWQAAPDPSDAATVQVWRETVVGNWEAYRGHAGRLSLITVLPASAFAAWQWELGWGGLGALLLACVVPAYYATVVSYSIGELLARPLVDEIAGRLPDGFDFRAEGPSLHKRLTLALPAYTTTAAVLTVGLLDHGEGAATLAITVLVALAVGIGLSTELTVLLGDAITSPVRRIRAQLAQVREGNFAARSPVTSGDELGELAHDVNAMAQGLAEREEMRAAFGTYMDKAVVELILSGAFPPEGIEAQASILFCDVRGFTAYAEHASAAEVIATLNQMFATIVPIVEQHGGHVDKFLGDGLLAVFGTPQHHVDHADRAVAAACEIAAAGSFGDSGLTVGVGVNSGTVVAGPLGGAGRLNFSVIGDAVNTAARVEAATRQTGDDVLITEATRRLLTRPPELTPRGVLELKGKAQPVELYAPMATTPVRPTRPAPARE